MSVRGDHALALLAGELDAATRHEVDDALAKLARSGARHLMIDFEGLTFVGTSGVHVIATFLAAYPESVVTVAGASTPFIEMLQMTGLDAHLALLR